MKRNLKLVVILVLILANSLWAQKMTVKDSEANILMEVVDEGEVGSLLIPMGTAPSDPSNKLYNVSGSLFWNGTAVGTAGSGGGWTDAGTSVYLTTGTDKVGIGDTSPTNTLDISGTIGIGDTQVVFLPDQTNFNGTLIIGNGGAALTHTSGSDGQYNNSVGIRSLISNTTGYGNTATGSEALLSNTTGHTNTGTGAGALRYNTTGHRNTAVGATALRNNTAGLDNTANGFQSLFTNTIGYGNVALGMDALYTNTGGFWNTAVGKDALRSNDTGEKNTAIGYQSLYSNTLGDDNTSVGRSSLWSNSTGQNNTAVGYYAAYYNTTGNSNTVIGDDANLYNEEGSNNTIIGLEAGRGSSAHNKSGNIFIGYQAGFNETGSDKLYIENSNSSTPMLWGDFSTDSLVVNGALNVTGTSTMAGFQMTTGATSGYVLTSDASGNGTWQAAGAGSGDFSNGGEAGGASRTLGNTDAYSLGIMTNNQTRIYVADGGRVGIGNPTPTYKLDVGGKIGIDDYQMLYLADQSEHEGSLFLGTGGTFLSTGEYTEYNTGLGFGALYNLAIGSGNTAVGYQAMAAAGGFYHTAVGYKALYNSGGSGNTSIGYEALYANTDGEYNTATGYHALYNNTNGYSNTANGYFALENNTTGDYNTAIGHIALYFNNGGNSNTAVGNQALRANSSGNNNTALGYYSLYSNSTGNNNVAIGDSAFATNTTGSYNTALGHNTSIGGNYTNSTAIGANARVLGNNMVRIGDNNVTIISGNVDFSFPSDRNKKENFIDVDGEYVLDEISKFEIPSWNYIGQDPSTSRHYGPMGQDFFAAFGRDELGTIGNETSLCGSDVSGINMIAIQALEKRTQEVKDLKQEIIDLKERLQNIEKLLSD